ncbi:Mu transposase domain-containing protein [Halovibrio sp. HP20-50]|uniref:Mu transposase domain-containing protein n=1 Tax=Halovibrio sp. HP20-59 TaxID=3080275 RepID=UPI00294AFE7C|nr:hypothetical protein [Halovibrio sp. HP20-59]MEA2119745.1 hypothetical protein [Halovibrio sp. HP20-59]
MAAKEIGDELTDQQLETLLYGQTEAQRDTPRFNSDLLHDAVRGGLTRQQAFGISSWLELGDVPRYSWGAQQYTKWMKSLPKKDLRRLPAGALCVVGSVSTQLRLSVGNGQYETYDILVASLPVSEYSYFALYPSGCELGWLKCLVAAFAYFGGVPAQLDITSPVGVRQTYDAFCGHYDVDVTVRKKPPLVRTPTGENVRQKCLNWVSGWRDHIDAQVILGDAEETLIQLNNIWNGNNCLEHSGEFTANAFLQLDAQHLKPMPKARFTPLKQAKVHSYDNHVQFRDALYSVPHRLAGQTVQLELSNSSLVICSNGAPVARHALTFERCGYVTDMTHRPSKEHLDTLASLIINTFYDIGADAVRWCRQAIISEPIAERAFRRCIQVRGLVRQHSRHRLNGALKAATEMGCHLYGQVRGLLFGEKVSAVPGQNRVLRSAIERRTSKDLPFTIDRNDSCASGRNDEKAFGNVPVKVDNVSAISRVVERYRVSIQRIRAGVYKRVSHSTRAAELAYS